MWRAAPISGAAMAFGGGDGKLCKVPRQLSGNQTLAAMVFRSEAQDKARSTEFNAETSTRCCAGSGCGALELAALL